ncbi:MAG: hypothetical protein MZV63_13305 [Marinilabiliales bacterium]|nr:hypothetical protein [Marinilabiliales bacterium]
MIFPCQTRIVPAATRGPQASAHGAEPGVRGRAFRERSGGDGPDRRRARASGPAQVSAVVSLIGGGLHGALHQPLPQGADGQPRRGPGPRRRSTSYRVLRNLETRRLEVIRAILAPGQARPRSLYGNLQQVLRRLTRDRGHLRAVQEEEEDPGHAGRRRRGLEPLAELMLHGRRRRPSRPARRASSRRTPRIRSCRWPRARGRDPGRHGHRRRAACPRIPRTAPRSRPVPARRAH